MTPEVVIRHRVNPGVPSVKVRAHLALVLPGADHGVRLAIGSRWTVLTREEATALATALNNILEDSEEDPS